MMNTRHSYTDKKQTEKIEELYNHCQQLKSNLWFMGDEVLFLERLLNSYVFEPNTPNLFERLQDFLERLKLTKNQMDQLSKNLSRYEKSLGGALDATDATRNATFYQEYEALVAALFQGTEDFNKLKSEIFNYAGGILKKRKPGTS